MITLYYIRGITRLDEPVFDTPENQRMYFSLYQIASIDSGFYPPHYKNEILLDTGAISFLVNANYLSLSFENKDYYYFVDSIEYISEDVIKLFVTMDVIQTYMFDCEFGESDISRLSIKRWNDNSFNRAYLRSNRSKGSMEQYDFGYYTDMIGWYVIILDGNTSLYYETSSKTPFPSDWVCYINNSPITSTTATEAMQIITIPVSLNSKYDKISVGNKTSSMFDILLMLRLLSHVNGVLSITYYNYNIFSKYINVTYDSSTMIVSSNDSTNFRVEHIWNAIDVEGGSFTDIGYFFVPISHKDVPFISLTPSISFIKNTSIKTISSSVYNPVMCDENYLQIEWGERIGFTTYPLYQLTSNNLTCYAMINYIDGSRLFYISDDKSTDKYQSMIVNSSIEQISLSNNAWETYLSQNMATLTRGRALAYQQIGYNSMKNALKYNFKTNEKLWSTAWNVSDMGEADMMAGLNMKKAVNYANGLIDVSQGVSVYSQSREIQEANLKMQPDNQKVGNSCASDILGGLLKAYLKISHVTDYEDVWKDYEENGYDVAIHAAYNLFQQNTRYYYDIVLASIKTLNLSNIIGDTTTIENIKSRFVSGLRLWHTTNGVLNAEYIGDYTYDNVENEFIKEE